MRRMTILLGVLAALMLVPAAQAFAFSTVEVTLAGTGHGEVSSVGGAGPLLENGWEGEQPIDCHGAPPGEGACVGEASLHESAEGIFLREKPAAGSELEGFAVEAGGVLVGCPEENGALSAEEEEFLALETFAEGERPCFLDGGASEEPIVLTVFFNKTGPAGPTNLAPLTITKSAGGSGGVGSVSSKPKGINCGAACNSAVASMYKKTPVTLTAKPLTGSTFVEWKGACSGASTTCTVPMEKAESVQAVFGGASKAILNPQALTLAKAGEGKGAVKAAGLSCEAECTSTTVLYQGPTGVAPKNKPGKTVELKAAAAYGSEFSGWSGAGCSGKGACTVTMEEAKEVTAEFSAKPTATLTLNKGGSGNGAVSSKPKAINCGTTCTTQSATVPEGEAVLLKEKPGTGMTFTGWSGGGCSGTGETCTVSLSKAETVTASFSGSPKPIPNQQELTLNKAGSGYGTVKAAGLTCEVLCTSTVSLYQGPTGVAPKNKPGKAVTLKATSAPGSKTVAWSGCESNPSPSECVVTMEEAKTVTATFDEIE